MRFLHDRCTTLLAATLFLPIATSLSTTPPDAGRKQLQQSRHAGRDPLLSLNLNLDALARSKAPERAQELFHRITALHDAGYYEVQPDTVSFNSVLKAWSQVSSPAKALEFWESVDIVKNIRSYNTFLLSLATVGMFEAATQLLEHMQCINAATRPDRISWNTVLLAHVHATSHQEQDVAEAAERLVRRMMQGGGPAEEGDRDPGDDEISPPLLSVDPYYVPPTPDATSFNILISCIHRHGGKNTIATAQRVDGWLRFMKDQTTDSQAASGGSDDAIVSYCRPDAYTYTAILKAWKDVSGPIAIQRALEILREAEETVFGDTAEDSNSKDHLILVTLVIQILCNNKQPEQAEKILFSSLPNPDATAYSSVMQGYSTAKDVDPKVALQTVLRLWHRMRKGGIEPTPTTFTILIRTASLVNGALAERILHQMVSSSSTTLPTVIHFNAALDGYAKTTTDALAAERLWRSMEKDHGVEPDIVTYNTVLRAAANGYGSQRTASRRIGHEVVGALRENDALRPTSITFHYYFKLLRRLVPDATERWKLQQEAFAWCCSTGCLNSAVLRQVTLSLTVEQQQVLLGGTLLEDFVIPSEWSRNAI